MNFRPPVRRLIIAGYVAISVVIIMLFLLEGSPLFQYHYFMLGLWMCGTVAACVAVLRSNMLQLLFLFFMVLDVQFNTMKIAQAIYQLGFLSILVTGDNMRLFLINVLVLLLFTPPLWYLFLGLFKKVINADIDKSYWRFLFLIPISSYVYCVFTSVNYSLKSESDWLTALFILLLLSLFSLLSYAAVLLLLSRTHDSLLATENAAVMGRQLLIQNEQYKKLTENIRQTERVQHDMRHHFIVLKGYVENHDYANADLYLDNCIGKELINEEKPICENHAVDMLLRHFTALARAAGAEMRVSVQLSNGFQIPDSDLCVVFGNLAENAVESCAKQQNGNKFIEIKAKTIHDGMLAIAVTNSFSGTVQQRGDNFISSKHSGIGIGTYSIRSIAEKSGGSCKFSFEDRIFKAQVLLVPCSSLEAKPAP